MTRKILAALLCLCAALPLLAPAAHRHSAMAHTALNRPSSFFIIFTSFSEISNFIVP